MATKSKIPAKACSWDSDLNPDFDLFVRGNAEEIIPGVSSPLTATWFEQMDYAGAVEIEERIHVHDLVPTYPPPVSNFISFFGGRCVLNLAWANALIATWTTTEGSGLMEQFITSDKVAVGGGALKDRSRAEAVQRTVYGRWWPSCVAAVDANNARIRALGDEQRGMDLGALSDGAIWRYLVRLEKVIVHVYANHIGVSGASGEFASLAGKLLAAELGDRFEESMVAGLTSGLGDIESSLPGFALWDVGRFVSSKQTLHKEVAAMGAQAIDAALTKPKDAAWREFAARFAAFIDEFGFRGQSECDVASPSWSEDHTFVLSVIKANAAAGAERDPRPHAREGARLREDLEARIEALLSPSARREFVRYKNWLQTYARGRERTKACWVRAIRLSRPVALEMARRATACGLISEPADLWMLTYPEVRAIFAGKPEASYRERIAARKLEKARLERFQLPDVFQGIPELVPREAPPEAGGRELAGLGVSAGVASGRARIITSAAAAEETDLQPGEVLVAPFTDAAWTPLFVSAAAEVVETGGMLSHAATVAREYGIPAVVAVRGATGLIKNGEIVTVDGGAGRITIG